MLEIVDAKVCNVKVIQMKNVYQSINW